MSLPGALAAESYCYLTTTGRVSGEPRTIEIWFAVHDNSLYLLAGNHRSDWVLNLRRNAGVSVRVADTTFAARGRIVSDTAEDALARLLLLDKYASASAGDLTSWGRDALPAALDLVLSD